MPVKVGEFMKPHFKGVSIITNGQEKLYKSIIEVSRETGLDRDVVKHFALFEVLDNLGRKWSFKNVDKDKS